jgi:tetratricopeptide (TPR) repeat protein
MLRFGQNFKHTHRLLFWLVSTFLVVSIGCLGPVKGTIALRNAQDLFNEASLETIEEYKQVVKEQDVNALPPTSPHEKYQQVVEIIERRVLPDVSRNDLKVNAQAIAAYAHWYLGNYTDAKKAAEAGLDLYKRSSLTTNRRDYGMLLILGGLVEYTEAFREYQREKDQVEFLAQSDAEGITKTMQEALNKINKINGEMDIKEPIVIYANQQQLFIIKNIIHVWGSLKVKEDRKKAICYWSNRALEIMQTNFPKTDYPAKPHVDKLKRDIEKLKKLYEPCS